MEKKWTLTLCRHQVIDCQRSRYLFVGICLSLRAVEACNRPSDEEMLWTGALAESDSVKTRMELYQSITISRSVDQNN